MEGRAQYLSRELREAWRQAPKGDAVVRIHPFGIENAQALDGVSLSALVEAAGIPKPYVTEVRKGMRLADYVTVRKSTGP